MTQDIKPVAKSLHTVTVLVQIATLHMELGKPKREAMVDAMQTLGLAGRPDPYELEEKALRMMDKR